MLATPAPSASSALPRTRFASEADLAAHRAFWREPRSADDVRIPLPDAVVDEIDASRKTERPAFGEVTRAFVEEVRGMLDHGPGLAIVEGFPVDRWSEDEQRRLVPAFVAALGPLRSQSHDGTLLYDVADRRVRDPRAVRSSVTNLAQPFHTDGPWFETTARHVALYCMRSADDGGESSATSLLAAIDRLRELGEHDVVAALERVHPWHRQGEHEPDDVPFARHPVLFEDARGQFGARWYESYVRSGYDVAGEAVPPDVDRALARLTELLASLPSVRFVMRPGELQLAHNRRVLHARGAFVDRSLPGEGRRLLRMWIGD